MIKKFLSLLLVLILLLSATITVTAAPTTTPIKITVYAIKGDMKESHTIEFLKSEDELYILPKDVPKITKFKFNSYDFTDKAFFSLKDKSLYFSYNDTSVYYPNNDFKGEYSGAIKANGKYYLPVSSILPWLDCSCENNDGKLTFTSSPITFYEITYDFRQLPSINAEDYFKDDVDVFWTLVGSNAINNILNMGESVRRAFFAACHNNDSEFFFYDAYVNAFLEMAKNRNVSTENLETVKSRFSLLENAFSLADATGLELTKIDSSKTAKNIIEKFNINNSYYDDISKSLSDLKVLGYAAKAQKIMQPFAESAIAFEASLYTIDGYNNALSQIKKGLDKKSVLYEAANKSLSTLKNPNSEIYDNFFKFVVEEGIDKLFEELPVFKVANIASIVLSFTNAKMVKTVDSLSKITVYADISSTASDKIRNVNSLNADTQKNAKDLMLLSSLATKGTLDLISSYKNALADPTDLNNCIKETENFIGMLSVCQTGTDAELTGNSTNNWQNRANRNKQALAELGFITFKETNEASNNIVGLWGATVDGVYGEFEFDKDGTGSTQYEESQKETFTWYIEDDKLYFKDIEPSGFVEFELEDDCLWLTPVSFDDVLIENPESIKFEPLSKSAFDSSNSSETSSASSNSTSEKKLIGKWGATIDGEYGEFRFEKDGSGSVWAEQGLMDEFVWSLSGDTLTMTTNTGDVVMQIKIEGKYIWMTPISTNGSPSSSKTQKFEKLS